jgi:hypothetical protein
VKNFNVDVDKVCTGVRFTKVKTLQALSKTGWHFSLKKTVNRTLPEKSGKSFLEKKTIFL